jgi:DNA-binding transcriptional ArsR family regulator
MFQEIEGRDESRPYDMDVFQALQTPRRREILRLLWNQELSAGEITKRQPEITFGAVSQHLRILEEAGLVVKRQEGTFHYYSAKKETLGSLCEYFEQLWSHSLYRLKIRAELEQARRGPGKSKKTRRKP